MQNNPQPHSDSSCYHCGEDVFNTPLNKHGRVFCCNGCVAVFELLNDNDLTEYYEFEDRPGIKLDQENPGLRYAFLDLEEIKEKLLLFAEGKLERVKFRIPSIHCSSCIWLLENIHQLNKGVLSCKVNFLKKEAIINYNSKEITLRELAELLFRIGYGADINLDSLNSERKNRNHLVIKLGVAGFCFGNIMLLSFPAYFSANELIGFTQKSIFGWLNIILSLPVLLYSASSYFSSALSGLRNRMINIDVPISLGITALFSRSIYEIISQTGPGYLDSLTGLVFFLLIGKWFQQKAYDAISFEKDYKAYFPVAITRLKSNIEEIVPLDQIAVGDVLHIHNEELVPCDAKLIDSSANIDYSFVTGESEPVRKEKHDRIFAGGKALNGGFKVQVLKSVSQSYLIELWNQEAFQKKNKRQFTGLIDVISKHFTIAVLSIALIAGIAWYFIDSSAIWQVTSAVLIVACPCALALSSPLTYGYIIRRFGKLGFFMKNAESLEDLSKADDIIFDKTGTISEGTNISLIYNGNEIEERDQRVFGSLGHLSSHPISKAIERYFGNHDYNLENFVERPGKGTSAYFEGDEYKIGNALWVNRIVHDQNKTAVYLEKNGSVIGYFNKETTYRKGLKSVVNELAVKYRISMLSGDNNHELKRLKSMMPNRTELLFNQSPYDKLRYIRDQQMKGQHVVMIGDGLNDAGALKQSDFGIAVSENINHFSPSCDAILDAKKFHLLPLFIGYSRTAMRIVKSSMIISLLYNLVGISMAITGMISPLIAAILMPLSSISVVLFIALTVSFSMNYKLRRIKSEKGHVLA